MAIDIEVFQEYGPVQGTGRGSTIQINNVGWRSLQTEETYGSYAQFPVRRPQTGQPALNQSYDYYTYFVISGEYLIATRPRIIIKGNITGAPPEGFVGTPTGARLFVRLTDTYSTPTNTHDGNLTYYNNNTLALFPRLSTIGPNQGLSHIRYLQPNTTYYTEFIHTKLYVDYMTEGTGYGNIGETSISCEVDEYEGMDL